MPTYNNDNGIGNNPTDATFSAATSIKMYQLNGTTAKTGPGITIKVMAGDKFNVQVSSFFKLNSVAPATPIASPLIDIVNALTTSISSSAVLNTHNVTNTELNNAGAFTNVNSFLTSQSNTNNNTAKPKAYLNWILFDEQFNYVGTGSGSEQVNAEGVIEPHVKTGMPVTKSGYLYVYVSNETPNIPVYFDNLQVSHERGRLLETNEYYPYGLKMANISYRAASVMVNRYGYNGGNEYEDEGELNYSNTFYRKYDAQIGRFTGVDMLAESFASLNPYQYSGNNPIMFNDPSGALLGQGNGHSQKGPDENYHADWVNDNLWGDIGFYNDEYWGGGGGGGGGGGSYNFVMSLWRSTPAGTNVSYNNVPGGNGITGYFYDYSSTNQIVAQSYIGPSQQLTTPRGTLTYYYTGYAAAMDFSSASGNSTGNGSVGKPGLGESLIPIWGSGRAAVDDFQNGHIWSGIGNSLLAVSDVFLVKSLITGAGKLAVAGIAKLAARDAVAGAGKAGGEYLYHYATPGNAEKIMQEGLTVAENRPFLYATNNGALTPMQAQIELALGNNQGLRTSLIQIDVGALRGAGISPIIGPRNVAGGMFGAGGGIEFLFNQSIPKDFLHLIH